MSYEIHYQTKRGGSGVAHFGDYDELADYFDKHRRYWREAEGWDNTDEPIEEWNEVCAVECCLDHEDHGHIYHWYRDETAREEDARLAHERIYGRNRALQG